MVLNDRLPFEIIYLPTIRLFLSKSLYKINYLLGFGMDFLNYNILIIFFLKIKMRIKLIRLTLLQIMRLLQLMQILIMNI